MVSYILLVAVVNLGLGFAAAVYLGRRYRELVSLGSEPAPRAGASATPASDPLTRPALAPAPAKGPAARKEPAITAAELDELIASVVEGIEPAKTPSANGHAPDGRPPGENPPSEQDRPDVASDPPREMSPGEACVRDFNQKAQQCHLQDTLGETSAGPARTEQRRKPVEGKQQTDALTELGNGTGLEARLAEWWEKDPHRARQLNAAMIDVDRFARLNERLGQEVGDRILRAIARLVTAETRGHALAARFSGQRFVLLFADVDARFTAEMAERIRQTIELAHFECHGNDIRVTVSCGVVEAGSDDTSETLCARAEATLREAKRYGRNRTFVHEGKYPTPVVPPNFTLEEKSVVV